jgi:hypothetical protein
VPAGGMIPSCSPDALLWQGLVLKKGVHFMDSWKERTLKLFADRVDYFDATMCVCGSMSLVSTTTVEVINDSIVNVHTVGRKEKEK